MRASVCDELGVPVITGEPELQNGGDCAAAYDELPERWLAYANVGRTIQNFPIIAFKVPLKKEILKNVPPQAHFTPEVLLSSVRNLGLVIDLTDTEGLYEARSIRRKGVHYAKVACSGKELPDEDTVDEFFSAMDDYLKSPVSKGRIVGVHGTHGVNKTGYLVCRYLVERCWVDPNRAIQLFETARGHEIERQDFLEDLRKLTTPLMDSTIWDDPRPPDNTALVLGRGPDLGRGFSRGRGRLVSSPQPGRLDGGLRIRQDLLQTPVHKGTNVEAQQGARGVSQPTRSWKSARFKLFSNGTQCFVERAEHSDGHAQQAVSSSNGTSPNSVYGSHGSNSSVKASPTDSTESMESGTGLSVGSRDLISGGTANLPKERAEELFFGPQPEGSLCGGEI